MEATASAMESVVTASEVSAYYKHELAKDFDALDHTISNAIANVEEPNAERVHAARMQLALARELVLSSI